MNYERPQQTPEKNKTNQLIEEAVQKVKDKFSELPMDKSREIIREVITEEEINKYYNDNCNEVQVNGPCDNKFYQCGDYVYYTNESRRPFSENDGLVFYIKKQLMQTRQDVAFWQKIEQAIQKL